MRQKFWLMFWQLDRYGSASAEEISLDKGSRQPRRFASGVVSISAKRLRPMSSARRSSVRTIHRQAQPRRVTLGIEATAFLYSIRHRPNVRFCRNTSPSKTCIRGESASISPPE